MGASTIAATPSADLTALSTELLEARWSVSPSYRRRPSSRVSPTRPPVGLGTGSLLLPPPGPPKHTPAPAPPPPPALIPRGGPRSPGGGLLHAHPTLRPPPPRRRRPTGDHGGAGCWTTTDLSVRPAPPGVPFPPGSPPAPPLSSPPWHPPPLVRRGFPAPPPLRVRPPILLPRPGPPPLPPHPPSLPPLPPRLLAPSPPPPPPSARGGPGRPPRCPPRPPPPLSRRRCPPLGARRRPRLGRRPPIPRALRRASPRARVPLPPLRHTRWVVPTTSCLGRPGRPHLLFLSPCPSPPLLELRPDGTIQIRHRAGWLLEPSPPVPVPAGMPLPAVARQDALRATWAGERFDLDLAVSSTRWAQLREGALPPVLPPGVSAATSCTAPVSHPPVGYPPVP